MGAQGFWLKGGPYLKNLCQASKMPDLPNPVSQNPRYQGATPEGLARALLRPLRVPSAGGQAVVGDEVTVEKPLPDEAGNDGSHLR